MSASLAIRAMVHPAGCRVAHRFSGGGRESGCDSRPRKRVPHSLSRRGHESEYHSCPPPLKRWATPLALLAAPRRGMLLLEVVVALTIMVTAMGLLGAQLVGGIKMTMHAEEQTRAAQLADRMLALLELDPNTVERFVTEREADGDFGEQYPEWFWRAYAEELEETENLEEEQRISRVTIEILHQPGVGRDADIDEARVVRRLHMLKAAQATIDLERDFGVSAEMVATITELIANIAPEAIGENGEIDIRILMQYAGTEDLFALMPMLAGLADGGYGTEDLSGLISGSGLSGDAISSFLEAGLGGDISIDMIQNFLGGAGADLDLGAGNAIIEMIKSQLGDQISEQELQMLISAMGQGGLSGGGASRGGGGRSDSDSGGGGRDISDLNRERQEQNEKWEDR